MSFDPENIIQGPTVILKRCEYTGFAANVHSVENAITMLEFIGNSTGSTDCLPFAVSLIEEGKEVSIAEDNGEFGCGSLISKCLKKLDGYNVMVCVSRKVRDSFVHEMIQGQKHRLVKESVTAVVDLLLDKLTKQEVLISNNKSDLSSNSFDDMFDAMKNNITMKTEESQYFTRGEPRLILPAVKVSIGQGGDIDFALKREKKKIGSFISSNSNSAKGKRK